MHRALWWASMGLRLLVVGLVGLVAVCDGPWFSGAVARQAREDATAIRLPSALIASGPAAETGLESRVTVVTSHDPTWNKRSSPGLERAR